MFSKIDCKLSVDVYAILLAFLSLRFSPFGLERKTLKMIFYDLIRYSVVSVVLRDLILPNLFFSRLLHVCNSASIIVLAFLKAL